MYKLKEKDYELIFEYETHSELLEILKLTNNLKSSSLELKRVAQEQEQKEKQEKKYVIDNLEREKEKIEIDIEREYKITFFDLEPLFIEHKRKYGKVKKETYTKYYRTFKMFQDYFKKTPINNITIHDFENFQYELSQKKNIKNVTINNYFSYCNSFLEFAKNYKYIRENNIKGIENLKDDKTSYNILSDDELLQILYSNIENEYKIYLMVLMYTGCRISEIMNIKEIKEKDNIKYIEIENGKTKNSIRQVPLHQDLVKLLDNNILKFPLFKKNDKNQTKRNYEDNLQKKIRRRYNKIIIEKTKVVHSLRHTFISKLINKKPLLIPIVQDIIGHSKDDNLALTIDIYGGGFDLENKLEIINTFKINGYSFKKLETYLKQNKEFKD